MTPRDQALIEQVLQGKTIVIHAERGYKRLRTYAEERGLFVLINRETDWGNPFAMRWQHGRPDETDRPRVIDAYRTYLQGRADLLARIGELKGKVLGCHCTPRPCHGDILAAIANGS